jgi:hypothetical protein
MSASSRYLNARPCGVMDRILANLTMPAKVWDTTGLLIRIITAGAVTFINPIGSKVSGYFNNLNNNLP